MDADMLRAAVMQDRLLNLKAFCKEQSLNRKKMKKWLAGEHYILAELAVKSRYFGHMTDRDPVVSDQQLMTLIKLRVNEIQQICYIDGDNVFHELNHITQNPQMLYVCFFRKDTPVQKFVHLAQYANFHVYFTFTLNKEAADHSISMQMVTHDTVMPADCEFILVSKDAFADETIALLSSRGRNCKKLKSLQPCTL